MDLFHLLPAATWAAVRDQPSYAPPSLAAEGFIHLSRARQLLASAERYFAGRDDVVVLALDGARLRAPLRDDAVRDDHFPHLYGPLDLDAVVAAVPLRRGADGRFEPPAWPTR